MKKIPASILAKLQERKENSALRTLMDAHHLIDFYSNDYLGLAKWEMNENFPQGSTGSRLISGNTNRTEEIEKALAKFFGMPSGLIFNSGYDANLGLFSSVPQKGDSIIYDQLIHASIRDGIKMSQASAYSFQHNDIAGLRERLERAEGNCYVAVEGVYSMDGDEAPLEQVARLCEEFGAYLIVDEAHSGGIYGDKGEGLVSKMGLNDLVFAKVITFGKAFGSHGAIVLGSPELSSFLINFARSFLYTTALSPHSQERLAAVVSKCEVSSDERTLLNKNIQLYKKLMGASTFECLPSDSPIQIVMCPGNDEAKTLAKKILEAGFAVKAILYPTVPKGGERLRFCIHSYNTEDEINNLVAAING